MQLTSRRIGERSCAARVAAVAFVLVLASGCSTTRNDVRPDPGGSDGKAAVALHMGCVIYWAGKLDDGAISAEALASKIVPICRDLHLKSMRAVAPPSWGDTVEERARALELEHTWAAVLFHRDGATRPR